MKLHPFNLAAGVCLFAGAASACWSDIPLEEVISRSPTIVVGKIERIKVAEPPASTPEGLYTTTPPAFAFDIAYIRVSKILKKKTTDIDVKEGKEIPLSMPSVRNETRVSTDIIYPQGMEGVWILSRSDKDTTFSATYPKDFQPLEKESNIAAIVAKQKN